MLACLSVRSHADRWVFCYLVFRSCRHLSQAEWRVQEANTLYIIEMRKGLHIHRDWGKCILLNPGLVVIVGHEPSLCIQSFLNPGGEEALGPRPAPFDPYKMS
jgi:hypothetical protein